MHRKTKEQHVRRCRRELAIYYQRLMRKCIFFLTRRMYWGDCNYTRFSRKRVVRRSPRRGVGRRRILRSRLLSNHEIRTWLFLPKRNMHRRSTSEYNGFNIKRVAKYFVGLVQIWLWHPLTLKMYWWDYKDTRFSRKRVVQRELTWLWFVMRQRLRWTYLRYYWIGSRRINMQRRFDIRNWRSSQRSFEG